MSTLTTLLLIILPLVGFLAYDLKKARYFYYWNNTESDLGRWSFLRWWASEHVSLLSVMGGIAVILGLALLLQDYTLDLPDVRQWWVQAPKIMRWGVRAAGVLTVIVVIDLIVAWWSYRSQQDWSAGEISFLRWWVRKRTVEICAVSTAVCLAVGGIWATYHFHLLDRKGESYGYLTSARQYFGAKKYREAVLELRNAVRQNPNDADAHFLMGLSYQRLGSLPDARQAYKEALRIDPKHAAAHLHLGRVALAMKDTNEAIREAEQALALEPETSEPRLLLAVIHLATGRWEQATEQYRAVLKSDPADLAVRKSLIELLVKRRAYAEARLVAEDGLKESPRNTELEVGLAAALNGEGRFIEAERILKGAAIRDMGSPLPLMGLGDMHFQRGEFIPALQNYEEALNRSPDQLVVMNNIALINADHGYDLDRAAQLASRLYGKFPDDPTVLDTMGWVLFKQGKMSQALPLLRKAAVKSPKDPAINTHYRTALSKVRPRD